LRIYTDSTAVLREAATRSGDRESATEHARQAQGKQPETEQAIEPDLQEHAIRTGKPLTDLEKEIQNAVMKHQKILQRDAAAHEQHHPPPPPKHDPIQERGMSMIGSRIDVLVSMALRQDVFR
jgi:hypothetical protein